MEYSPWAKINKSPKEKQALIDAPPIKAQSLYAKTYAKHGKTIGQSKDAQNKAYEAVEKQHGKDVLEKLKEHHNKNETGEMIYRPVRKKSAEDERERSKPSPHGIKPNIDWYKKGGKISTAEHGNPKHKHCW